MKRSLRGRVAGLALAVFDGRALRRVHLDGVAHALHRPPVLEVGTAQDGAGAPIHRDDVVVGFEALVPEKIRGKVRIESQPGIANGHVADQVHSPERAVMSEAVGGQRGSGAQAVCANASSPEVIRIPTVYGLGRAGHVVDRHLTRTAAPLPGVGGDLERHREGQSDRNH